MNEIHRIKPYIGSLRDRPKVFVAMSGGVDSSVAAALLKKQRFDLIGVFMKFWSESSKDGLTGAWNRCCSPEAEKRARIVAGKLDIPFYVFNFEKEFKKIVVDSFLKEYKANRTPNPCVICNKQIKFGLLLKKALLFDIDYVATGHYVRLSRKIRNSKSKIQNCQYKLFRGKDKDKDQSYFLWQLDQKQLKHILFPIGNYSKTQVRDLAKKFDLPVLNVPESMEICFIPTTVSDFLARHIKPKPGKIITTESSKGEEFPCRIKKRIGQHQGLIFYTIGQRRGIELSGGPFYVVDKDLKKNALIVTPFFNDKKLYKKSLIAKNVNWISGKEPELPLKIKVQIRYGHKVVSAIITKDHESPSSRPRFEGGDRKTDLKSKTYLLKFDKAQRAITSGQSAVFYSIDNRELLGGGIIC